MCGLVGAAGNLEFKDEALIKRLLVFDYFRGPDSTGFAAIRKSGEAKIAKLASHPLNLFDTKRFDTALSAYSSLAFIGHNRFATKGKVNDINAHPYVYDHIVGAHNGTLEKKSWEALNKMLGEDTDVDSKAIIACIAKFGIEETVAKMEGAWALVWVDTEKKTLNFLRNNERTLWFSLTEKFNKIFWASEYKMMDLAIHSGAEKDMQKLYKTDTKACFFPFVEDWLYTVPLENLEKGYEDKPDFKIKKLKGKGGTYTGVPFTKASTTGGGGDHKTNHGKTPPKSTTTSLIFSSKKDKKASAPLHIELAGSPSNPFGDARFVDDVDFQTLGINGCGWCRDTIDFSAPGITLYTERDIAICPSCGTNHEKQSKLYVKSLSLKQD